MEQEIPTSLSSEPITDTGVIVLTQEESDLATKIEKYSDIDGLSLREQFAVMKRTMFKDFDNSEIALTFERAKHIGANLFSKELWAYKDAKSNLVLVCSRQFLGKKAEENPEFDGLQSGVVYEKDEFSMDTFSGEVKHKIVHHDPSKRGNIVGSWAVAWRRNGRAMTVYALRKDYDKGQYIWKSHTDAMMQKTAESIVLRKFALLGPSILGEGEYTPDEKEQEIRQPSKPDLSKIQFQPS